MGAPNADVVIEGVSNVHWPETYFESRAMAEPGTCQIVCRGDGGASLGSVVRLWVNGMNVWTGYVLSKTTTTWLPDKNDIKTIYQGADLNILLDKLIVYNHDDLAIHPNGHGKFKGEKPKDKNSVGRPEGAVPPATTIAEYLEAMLKDTDIDKVQPPIRLDVGGVTEPFNPTGAWGMCANAGATIRALFTDAASVAHPTELGSIIWYITPEGKLVFHNRDTEGGGSAEAQRNQMVSTDISNVRTEAFVFAGKLDPSIESKQKYLEVSHEGGGSVGSLISQYAEQVEYFSNVYTGARAKKIIAQQSTPAKLVRWQQFSGSLKPGAIVSVGGVTVPVRSVRYSFPTHDSVILDCEGSYDTLDPWGLILAAKRPPNRGMTPPQVVYLPLPAPGEERPIPPSVEPYTRVEESPTLKGASENLDNSGDFQLTYGYIKGSVEVYAASTQGVSTLGLDKVPRWEGVPTDPDTLPGQAPEDWENENSTQPLNITIGYVEKDPENGVVQIMLPPGYYSFTAVEHSTPGAWGTYFQMWTKWTEKEDFRLKSDVTLIVTYHVSHIIDATGGS